MEVRRHLVVLLPLLFLGLSEGTEALTSRCAFDLIDFDPASLENIRRTTERVVDVTFKARQGLPTGGEVRAFCKETYPQICEVMEVTSDGILDLNENSNFSSTLHISIRGEFLGITELLLECDGEPLELPEYTVRVTRSEHEDYMMGIFNTLAGAFIIFINFLLGTQLEVERIKRIVKFPVGPLTSICVQFLVMPLFGFALAKLIIPDNHKALQLSLFAAACSPGGGKSSFWTIIFDGNLDLSVTMTFTQTVIAIGMMPLWLKFLLGPYFFTERLQIPIEHLCLALGGLIGPVTIGMIAISFNKHLVERLNFVIKAITWCGTVFFTAFAIYVNWYAFFLFKPYVVICACALPWTGYLIAFAVALLARQRHRERITIAIETGVQNLAISALLIITAFPEPERDLALVMTFAIVLVTDKPLILLYGFGWLRRKFCRPTVHQSASQVPINAVMIADGPMKFIDDGASVKTIADRPPTEVKSRV
ncbi:hypothetical protein QR680_016991 [Steinernema hermaphroditum]|uniref:Uncharacterized protein n=1 Tax=Steinernema hermaphroditum TaxID=289476 RepID=A0AA39HF42_9BILA|nr:hypothetical protein QR680_016991 [Steinernema hermaphroditum]